MASFRVACADWCEPEDFDSEAEMVNAGSAEEAVMEWLELQDEMYEYVNEPLLVFVETGGEWTSHILCGAPSIQWSVRPSECRVTNGSREPLQNDAQTATSEKA